MTDSPALAAHHFLYSKAGPDDKSVVSPYARFVDLGRESSVVFRAVTRAAATTDSGTCVRRVEGPEVALCRNNAGGNAGDIAGGNAGGSAGGGRGINCSSSC